MKPLSSQQIAEKLIKAANFESTSCFEDWMLDRCDCEIIDGNRNYLMEYSLEKPFKVKCELSYYTRKTADSDWVVGVIDDESKGDVEFLFANGLKELYWKLDKKEQDEINAHIDAELDRCGMLETYESLIKHLH